MPEIKIYIADETYEALVEFCEKLNFSPEMYFMSEIFEIEKNPDLQKYGIFLTDHIANTMERMCGKLEISPKEFIKEAVYEKLNREGKKLLSLMASRSNINEALDVLAKVPSNNKDKK